jgi:hypothetical protein
MTKTSARFNLVATLAAAAVVFTAVAWYAQPHDAPAPADVPVVTNASNAASARASTQAASQARTRAAPAPLDVAQLGENAIVGDAGSRIAAIDALAHAPREQALPALRRALLSGDPASDRPHALNSLRELAATQGDKDGRIRDVVREVVYHGDDEALSTTAQETLDAIEQTELR